MSAARDLARQTLSVLGCQGEWSFLVTEREAEIWAEMSCVGEAARKRAGGETAVCEGLTFRVCGWG
jgi:hypothetical protein